MIVSGMSVALEEVDPTQLEFAEGIAYRKDHQGKIPFSGVALSYYPNGQKRKRIFYRDGKRHGTDMAWYQDGNQKHVVRYKEGQLQSNGSSWHTNKREKASQEFMPCHAENALEAICGKEEPGPSARFELCPNDNC